jgi:hypothetical protein
MGAFGLIGKSMVLGALPQLKQSCPIGSQLDLPLTWLERVLSATYGRPGLIPRWLSNSVLVSSMVDDESFDTQAEASPTRAESSPRKVAFFIKAVELYEVLDDILTSFYLVPISSDEFESKLGKVLELDGQLQNWRGSLPGYLLDRAANSDGILQRQAITLRIRLVPSPFFYSRCSSRSSGIISY